MESEELKFYTLEELNEICEREYAELQRKCDDGTATWGRWTYNPTDPPSIDIGSYEIVLERIDTVAKLGDWLMHMANKNWVTPDDLGQLVFAMRDLYHARINPMNGQGCA